MLNREKLRALQGGCIRTAHRSATLTLLVVFGELVASRHFIRLREGSITKWTLLIGLFPMLLLYATALLLGVYADVKYPKKYR